MAVGAQAQESLKLYAMTVKALRGEQLHFKPVTKATSASDYADELLDEFGIDVEAMGLATETPDWLLEAAFDRLTETFNQDYWQDVNQTTADMIETQLRDGIESGLSMQEIADAIEEIAPDRAGWRAMQRDAAAWLTGGGRPPA